MFKQRLISKVEAFMKLMVLPLIQRTLAASSMRFPGTSPGVQWSSNSSLEASPSFTGAFAHSSHHKHSDGVAAKTTYVHYDYITSCIIVLTTVTWVFVSNKVSTVVTRTWCREAPVASSGLGGQQRPVSCPLRDHFWLLATVPTCPLGLVRTSVPCNLQQAKFLFLFRDAHLTPLQCPYDGTFKVLLHGPKTPNIQKGEAIHRYSRQT